MNKLFNELRRRNVFRVAGMYAVIGWLLAQAASLLETSLGLPGWFDAAIVSALLLGMPVAIILAWAFEVTPEGVKLTASIPEGDRTTKTGKTLDYFIVGGLALVAVAIVTNRLLPAKPATTATVTAVAPDAETTAAQISDASIAVLPFTDLSPAGDQAYFSDGIAEEILNALAHVDGLDVASRTSSFAFKDRDAAGVPEIAAELKVRHVLEGSVRKAGASLRITAQLIDAENDRHVWSQAYDRPLTAENVFAIQEEIAAAIVAALADLMGTSNTVVPAVEVAKSTSDLSAYDLYLQARAFYQARENFEEADALLAEALKRDPNFADAWALRAAFASLYNEYVKTDRSYADSRKLVDEYTERALALNPDNARAIAARANFRMNSTWTLSLQYDIGEILADLKRATTLDPRDSSALNWLGLTYSQVGEIDKGLEIFAACEAFDPYFGPCAENYYDLLVVQGRFDEALAKYQQVLAKGIAVSGWANFALLARFDQKTAFMQATNHPSWLPGWRHHDALYEAFKHPNEDHSALIADINEYVRSRPHRQDNVYSNLLIPIGGFDATPYIHNFWGPDYTTYRRSPQFKSFIHKSGAFDYWRGYGFPPQCKAVGSDDFDCE